MDYVWILERNNSTRPEVHGDPERAVKDYMEYVLEVVPGGLDNEELELESLNGSYLARYYGDTRVIASLTMLPVLPPDLSKLKVQ